MNKEYLKIINYVNDCQSFLDFSRYFMGSWGRGSTTVTSNNNDPCAVHVLSFLSLRPPYCKQQSCQIKTEDAKRMPTK